MQRLEAKLLISSNDQMNQVEKNQVDQHANRCASKYADIIDLPHTYRNVTHRWRCRIVLRSLALMLHLEGMMKQ